MDSSELDYVLPPERIAQSPLPNRLAARLLSVNTSNGVVSNECVANLPRLVVPALFVVNNTRVLQARLFGHKTLTGGKVELLLLERLGPEGSEEDWLAIGKSSQGFAQGMQLSFPSELGAQVMQINEDGTVHVRLNSFQPILKTLELVGQLPLPSYIHRTATVHDMERYQTVFAREPGAVAAPTAGLHFEAELLQSLAQHDHHVVEITLHVGIGTFTPLRTSRLQDHRMHKERLSVSSEAADSIRQAKASGRPVVAVGTTVARALESVTSPEGEVSSFSGHTDLFIYPPYRFRCVDVLMTNFHLPKSTLLAMVMAFGGVDLVKSAYAHAVKEEYRFFSYGDAMLLAPDNYLRR